MEVIKKIISYLTFRQQDTKGNKYLGMMHGINKISILMALIGVIVLVIRYTR